MPKNSKKSINYPTWKVGGGPTPAEQLWICDGCGKAEWVSDLGYIKALHCYNCRGRKGGCLRMRKATAAEIAEAKKHLKKII